MIKTKDLKTGKRANGQTGKRANGQAMIEMAIFGAMFLLILSALVSYGFKYDSQQSTMMTAFRRAARMAANDNVGAGSYSISKDIYIPDVNDMFGIGSSTPIAASASVTRDPHLESAPADGSSLPNMVVDIRLGRSSDGSEQWTRHVHKTAGFRTERSITDKMLKKYQQVYGSGTLTALGKDPDTGEDGWFGITDANFKKNTIYRTCCPSGTSCTAKELKNCSKYTIQEIRMMDSCSGQTVDFYYCFKQAKKLVSYQYCYDQCNLTKTPGSGVKCDKSCQALTNPPNQNDSGYDSNLGGAWYAANWYTEECKTPEGVGMGLDCWHFPVLEQMFSFGAGDIPSAKNMLAQSDGTMINSERTRSMHTTVTPDSIKTEEYVKWGDDADSHKSYVYRDNMNEISGFENTYTEPTDYANVVTETLPTQSYSGEINETMETQK